jgi:hypothetical protein
MMNTSGGQAQASNYIETMRRKREEYIRYSERITELLDFVDKHPECLEMLRLADRITEEPVPQSQLGGIQGTDQLQ